MFEIGRPDGSPQSRADGEWVMPGQDDTRWHDLN